MAFIDEVQLHIRAGHGGNGVVKWRREKHRPLGGPGGGNGGRGGDVYAVATHDLAALRDYQREKNFAAANGNPGGNFGREGANGDDLELRFPVGTVLTNLETDEQFELLHKDDRVLILRGGRGGLGNEHFKTSVNRSPDQSTPGKPGQEADFHVELRLIADIGLVGLPSAGKSTLINMLTNSESKIGDYDFTTLEPHLGAFHGYIIADIPGIIEGASHGKGLGHKFLRHIRRTKMLAHLVAADRDDIIETYDVIRNELAAYDPELATKQEVIILTKSDLISPEELQAKQTALQQHSGAEHILTLTAYDDQSIKAVSDQLIQILDTDVQ
jgi:GTP-binding protein